MKGGGIWGFRWANISDAGDNWGAFPDTLGIRACPVDELAVEVLALSGRIGGSVYDKGLCDDLVTLPAD